MEFTLDTAAIRKRFESAIIGIRQDGTMAVLVQSNDNTLFDLVTGRQYGTGYGIVPAIDAFPTLIRPGDRCVGGDSMGTLAGKFRGFSGVWERPFYIQPEGNPAYISATIRPLLAAETKPEAETETGQHFNALEYWLTHGLKREQEWDKIRQIFRNALGDNPGCPFRLSYISEPEPNPLLARLTAAEQELAAIRAELERSAK
jgi:hypothetical protein